MISVRLNLGNQNLTSCCFSTDGKTLACGGIDGNFFLIENQNSLKLTKIFKIHSSTINQIFCERNYFYTASSDKTCRVWNSETLQVIRTLNLTNEKAYNIDCVDDLIITSGNKGSIKLWDRRIRFSVGNFFQGIPLFSAKFLKNSSYIVSSSISTNLFLWDIRKFKKNFSIFSLMGYKTNIFSFCLSKNNFFIYSLNYDGSICRWLLDFSNNLIKNCLFNHEKIFSGLLKSRFCKVTSDNFDKYIGHGSPEGYVYIRNQKKGKVIFKNKEHFGAVNEIVFHPSNKIFCSCGEDGFLAIKKFL